MYNGIVILEQWQKNENLIDKLLKDNIITKVDDNVESLHKRPLAEYVYVVNSDFFPNADSGCYLPTARVINNELVSSTRPLGITELYEAQKIIDSLEETKSSMQTKVNRLTNEQYQLSE